MVDENEQTEGKIDDMTKENKGEVTDTKKVEESQPAPEKKSEDTKPEKHEETVETSEIKTKPAEPKQPKEEKPVEIDSKKEPKKSAKKKDEKDSDFNYIVRIANTDVDGEKKVTLGLTQIKGLGRRMATLVADAAGIDREIKCGNLTDPQLEKINEVLGNLGKKAPSWMLNHRKDFDTGEDIHLISTDVELRLRDEINLLKMIRSYRGIRHESGLSVRGQRTRANNRKGLALGVSKKRP
ncbi:MAG: 30S ribosomal protein S13 [Thermoplasmatales archaeon]|nr:30S ribosomal protein S13 [Thermoplasmatales archaeon]